MPSTFLSVLRWCFLLGVTSFLVAVTVGLLAGQAVESHADRRPQEHRIGLRTHFGPQAGSNQSRLTFVDAVSGQLEILKLPEDVKLDHFSMSPWTDSEGRSQIVGICQHQHLRDGQLFITGVSLARFQAPDGTCLDEIETDQLPASRPCWLPGQSAQILYAGLDGQLYRFDFEGSQEPGTEFTGRDEAPRALRWAEHLANFESYWIKDVAWAGVNASPNRVLISLSLKSELNGYKTEIWWLDLSPDGRQVLEAGRLIGDQENLVLLHPMSARDAEGQPILIFLRRGGLKASSNHLRAPFQWDLCQIPLGPDWNGFEPQPVDFGLLKVLLSDVAAQAPTVSRDGSHIVVTWEDRQGTTFAERFAFIEEPSVTSLAQR